MSGLYSSWSAFLSKGGPAMLPLFGLSLFLFALSFEKLVMLWAERHFNEGELLKILGAKQDERRERLSPVHGRLDAAPLRMVRRILIGKGDQMPESIDEAALGERERLGSWLNTIDVITAIAPLLGLAGTVHGMIVTFDAITAYGTSEASLLSRGISQALLSTQLGLTIALPGLVLSVSIRSRIQRAQARVDVWAASLRQGALVHA